MNQLNQRNDGFLDKPSIPSVNIVLGIQKLSYFNSILVNISLMQVGLLSKVSSTCKLIRMICQILSFQIGSNLVGVSLSKSLTLTFGAAQGIILVKKSAFNNWSFHGFQLSVTIRVHLVSHTAQAYLEQSSCVSSIQSCFKNIYD